MNKTKNSRLSIFLVIPTIRSLDFLKEWDVEFKDCQIVIVEDHEKKEISIPSIPSQTIHHFSWTDIENDFGEKGWIFPRKNAGIRSYGFWKAFEMGADVIVTMDDDCYPTGTDFVQTHLENLSFKAPGDWFPTYPDPKFMFTRGFPYKMRNQMPVVVSHGLWSGVVDLDAKTLVKFPKLNLPPYPPIRQFVPQRFYFPMCSMNLAFKRKATPLMYFPLMGESKDGTRWGYDRFDDIWAGIFVKKIVDHLGWSVVNGSPFVLHKAASDRLGNVRKERRGLAVNEWLWKRVDEVKLTKRTAAECYLELAEKLRLPKRRYFMKLRSAMIIWAQLFMKTTLS
ncbi:MAG: hypothetical protein A2900_01255 [Candidatus Chisholmbacteria bacterium RIFCSPLOWO2_01_FULL_50_28]|uniref:Glycosyltransferase 2-like domain-containing protein n=1 Tax=Candidatus Chisholmbacteria bacterium RIFCSPHIGHO2_01_FULL_52_32 TaxID=1797591 RepID=A0A1G1VU11_9BACT|nr:MAG: hypothetical protein A2786_05485 [Candidatus Chisholmbacteria bacterium RIFCSPHIGHO2_01_FULL_52_32]OGY19716.1 MAG: hypothetical protein A2900_01255 [Candidatus Chisholmbacteria bacterium RIFCSPLOWO2_01_FULL_50_28]